MIVRHFLQWVRTAPALARADATSALARAYLHSDLSPDDRAAAEGAMMMLLDDASPRVRRALAEALAASAEAPPAIILALTTDQPDIAAIVLERSPLLLDADLVDSVGSGEPALQAAVARRVPLPCAAAAALAEVGSAESCLILIENVEAEAPSFSLDRIVERYGHLAAIREALLAREDLPAATRQALIARLASTLANFVVSRDWLESSRAQRIAREACEKATVVLAAETPVPEVRPLVTHLRQSGQLTPGLLLRAVLSGNVLLFEEALAELANVPLARVAAIVHDRGRGGLRALFDKAGLPASAYAGIRAALDAVHEIGYIADTGGATRLKRRMVERVLTRCEEEGAKDAEPLLLLLRRFALEAAREEARLFCDDLAA